METKIIQELPYQDYLAWLETSCQQTREDGVPRILICSHPKVLTMGRGDRQNSEQGFNSPIKDLDVVKINRGGGLTFHAENQVILYPVIRLNKNFGLNDHLCMMAKAYQNFLAPKIKLEYKRNPLGLWFGERKLASIGIELKHFVTAHGLAFNLKEIPFDQSFFHALNPCGLESKTYISLSELGIEYDWNEFSQGLLETYQALLKTKL